MPLIVFLFVLLVACQPVEPPFRIVPGSQQVTAGDPPIIFNALLGGQDGHYRGPSPLNPRALSYAHKATEGRLS